MRTRYLFIAAAIISSGMFLPPTSFAQRTNQPVNRATLTPTDRAFVQDAINRNNEAMALAQAALQQSKKKEVQQIAAQLMSDHRVAQKKLYAIAGIADTIPYSRSAIQPVAGVNRLPATDNLDSRRNRTVVSITDDKTANSTVASNTANSNNTPTINTSTGISTTQLQGGFDTSSHFGVNQSFNGNTSIDNANGVNNSNRTDVGSYSGRASETNTPAYTQNPVTGNQQLNNGINSNNTAIPVSTTNIGITNGLGGGVVDTVRQTGSTAGFQNPGTNLSSPGNERYSKTTPATVPNNNAGSDYGVAGVPINNTQTNALNTAPYSNNNINSNSVQTGRVLPTSDPAVVVNSSTASMGNKDVGFNNASTGANGVVQQSGQLAADNANGINRRTSEVINDNTAVSNKNSITRNGTTTTTGAITNNGAILAGRSRGTNNAVGIANPSATATNPTNNSNFYSEPFTVSPALSSLRTASPDTFDAQWAIQMNANQQVAITLYQSALRRTTNAQIKSYINTVVQLLRGHQFALGQWQAKQ